LKGDPSIWPPRPSPALFQDTSGRGFAAEPMVRRLTAGGGWIRTFSSALGRRGVRQFVRVGADLLAHRSSKQLPASAHRSSCRAADGGAVTHRPDQAASHHRRAVDGASSSRDRRFESVPLQRRVRCELGFTARDPFRTSMSVSASGHCPSPPVPPARKASGTSNGPEFSPIGCASIDEARNFFQL